MLVISIVLWHQCLILNELVIHDGDSLHHCIPVHLQCPSPCCFRASGTMSPESSSSNLLRLTFITAVQPYRQHNFLLLHSSPVSYYHYVLIGIKKTGTWISDRRKYVLCASPMPLLTNMGALRNQTDPNKVTQWRVVHECTRVGAIALWKYGIGWTHAINPFNNPTQMANGSRNNHPNITWLLTCKKWHNTTAMIKLVFGAQFLKVSIQNGCMII